MVAQCGVYEAKMVLYRAIGGIEILEDFVFGHEPDVVGGDVASVDRKCWVERCDGGHHAFLQLMGRITFGIAEWAAWLVCGSWGVFVAVYAAADGLGAVIVGAGFVG